MSRRILSLVISLCLIFQQTGLVQAAAVELNLAGRLAMMSNSAVSDTFRPLHIRFFSYDALRDQVRIMLDKGDVKDLKTSQLQASSQELFKYFLIGLNLHNDLFWVNLRPDADDKIIDAKLGRTDVGKIMLEADLQLKKDAARFTSPETAEGKEYWRKLYQKSEELFGHQQANIPAIIRPWIVPNEIIVRQDKNSAYIYKATLKVMLEEDYLRDSPLRGQSLYNFTDPRAKALNEYSAQLVRELIIPKLTKEVNLSQRYAALRQVYFSLILSRWFKSNFAGKAGKYTSTIDRGDLKDLVSTTAWSKSTYFNAYKKSFTDGEYNIKQTVATPTGQVIRTYFSGGLGLTFNQNIISGARVMGINLPKGHLKRGDLVDVGGDEIVSSPVTLKFLNLDDLAIVARIKRIITCLAALDWNVTIKDGKILDNERIVSSLPTIKKLFSDVGMQFVFAMTHYGRPEGKYSEEVSLRPMVDEATRLLQQGGINDIEIVLLPYDLSEARKVVEAKKSEAAVSGKKILFVVENIRAYAAEQSKRASVREQFERDIITLTGLPVDELVYVVEAFDKAHRGDEASMEIGQYIFTTLSNLQDQTAAGVKLADEANKTLEFQSKLDPDGQLVVIGGGKKFDKLKILLGDIAKRIRNKGKIFLVGALANPIMAAMGRSVGKDIMPKGDDVKVVEGALKKMRDNIRDNKLQVVLPKDFILKGGKVVTELTPDDEKVDIGPESIKEIVDYLDTLKKGDGIVINGGTGIFDQDWGSLTGTIAVIEAANRAAQRGVAVFFAGGDMSNAVKIVTEKTGLKLDPSILISTGGGSLLTALGLGIGNLIPMRAVMKIEGDVKAGLLDVLSAVKELFRGAVITPGASTTYKDTMQEGRDTFRAGALDISKTPSGATNVAVPDSRLVDRVKLPYELTGIQMIISPEQIPPSLKEALTKANTPKDVIKVVQKMLTKEFTARGITIQETQERSFVIDPAKIGLVGVDVSSLNAVKAGDGTLIIDMPILVKRGEVEAREALNQAIRAESTGSFEEFSWPEGEMVISNHQQANALLRKYSSLFISNLAKGDLSRIPILLKMINNLDPSILINPADSDIVYDKDLGVFISNSDINDESAVVPGFGKNLYRFRDEIYQAMKFCERLYIMLTPTFDTRASKPILVTDTKLQDAVLGLYARMYRHLFSVAESYFNDPRVFDSLRYEVGDFTQRLNRLMRSNDALEISQATASEIIAHLAKKDVNLNDVEKGNIERVFSRLKSENRTLFYLLELAGLLRVETFQAVFRNLKLDHPQEVKPSDKPNEAYDGSGAIGSQSLAFRVTSDINAQEPGYLGQYMMASQKLPGAEEGERLTLAAEKAKKMFLDSQIKAAKIKVKTGSGDTNFTDLIDSERLIFTPGVKALPAQLDYETTDKINSVYPVHMILDGREVGIIYFVDSTEFASGLKQKLAERNEQLDNIPRPFLVINEKGEEVYFGIRIDATPGGVEIGDQALGAAAKKGDVKLSGPQMWDLVGKENTVGIAPKLGAKEELARWRAIANQVMVRSGGRPLIYLKAQILKKLVVPGLSYLGRHIGWAYPFVGGGMTLLNPLSCSTNGFANFLNALMAYTGCNVSIIAGTDHMYTSSDKDKDGKNIFGHLAFKSTGAAAGVTVIIPIGEGEQAFFVAVRTPVELIDRDEEGKPFENMDADMNIRGGSVYPQAVIKFDGPVNVEGLVQFLSRYAQEFPNDIMVFTPEDIKDGSGVHTWEDFILSKATGSIIFSDHIKQVAEQAIQAAIGYDNEWSFTSKMVEGMNAIYLDRMLGRQAILLSEEAPLAATASSPLANQKDTGVGGIDFTAKAMMINYQPLGSFSSLKINLPVLSKAHLDKFDIEVELAEMERMVENEILPSGQRIKEVMAACVQRGEFQEHRDDILALLVKMGMLEEKNCCLKECSPEYKEALVLADALAV